MRIGSHIGVFEIVAPLGAGGMGEVYRARDARLEREVAVKVLPARSTRRRFARALPARGAALATLNHPNIATIHGFEDDAGRRLRSSWSW